MSSKAVFLDRDGVLNVDHGYLYKIEELEWMPGAKEAVAYLTRHGYLVFVVTNQSGIARGYYTYADMFKLHDFMTQALAQAGGIVTKFYYCPHHPTKGIIPELTIACNCRKPKPGLLLQAMQEYDLDKQQSFLIGDKPSDVEAAKAAGIKGYLFSGGNLLSFVQRSVE